MKNIYRHGDVDLIQVDKLPVGLKKIKTLTLALGEATGHHHSFTTESPVDVYEDNKGNKWIYVGEVSKLTHQEHKTLEIKKGYYQVSIEKEFDPFSEIINKIKD